MSVASDELAARIRSMIGHRHGIVEKKMFGGVGFMLNGNLVVGTTAKGALMVRYDPEKRAETMARPGAFEMHMGTKPMKGFLGVDGIEDDKRLRDWIAYAERYVKTLPPK